MPKAPKSQLPTAAPTTPKIMFQSRPKPPPFIILPANHPATAPTMIAHKIPISLSFNGYSHKDIQIFYIWRMFFKLNRLGMMLYRLWFYILVTLPILVFLPFLVLATLDERTYPQFFWLARNLWARPILYGMGCIPKIQREQPVEKGKSYMLVANHTSMLDIMLMLV